MKTSQIQAPTDPTLPASPLTPGVDPVASTIDHAQKAHQKMHGKPMHPKHVQALKGLLQESFGTSTEPNTNVNNVGTAGDIMADIGGVGGQGGIGMGGTGRGIVPRGDDPSAAMDGNHAFSSVLSHGSKVSSCVRTSEFVDDLIRRLKK